MPEPPPVIKIVFPLICIVVLPASDRMMDTNYWEVREERRESQYEICCDECGAIAIHPCFCPGAEAYDAEGCAAGAAAFDTQQGRVVCARKYGGRRSDAGASE